MLPISQSTALIKLLVAWKANKDCDYPIPLKKERKIEGKDPAKNKRAHNREERVKGGRAKQAANCFVRDTRKLWS